MEADRSAGALGDRQQAALALQLTAPAFSRGRQSARRRLGGRNDIFEKGDVCHQLVGTKRTQMICTKQAQLGLAFGRKLAYTIWK